MDVVHPNAEGFNAASLVCQHAKTLFSVWLYQENKT